MNNKIIRVTLERSVIENKMRAVLLDATTKIIEVKILQALSIITWKENTTMIALSIRFYACADRKRGIR